MGFGAPNAACRNAREGAGPLSAVVILSWDPAARILEYVLVNGGAGGAPERIAVGEGDIADISGQLSGLALPKVAELEAADDVVLVGNVSPAEVARCAVTAVGRAGDRKFKFSDKNKNKGKERKREIRDLPIAALGVADGAQADVAGSGKLEYLYTEQLDPPGCWLGCGGGIGAWLEQAERDKRRGQAERKWADPARFVNPYTFVPFAETAERAVPGVITGWRRVGCPVLSLLPGRSPARSRRPRERLRRRSCACPGRPSRARCAPSTRRWLRISLMRLAASGPVGGDHAPSRRGAPTRCAPGAARPPPQAPITARTPEAPGRHLPAPRTTGRHRRRHEGAGDGHGRGDDADFHAADDGQERPVGQVPEHGRAPGAGEPDQELRARGGGRGQKLPAVEAPVHQQRHRLVQQRRQFPCLAGLPFRSRPEDRAHQRPGARLHQGHQRPRGIRSRRPAPSACPAMPGFLRIRHLDGLAAVKGHRPVPAEHDPGCPRLPQRPGQDLEQPPHRRDPDPAAQVPQPVGPRADLRLPVRGSWFTWSTHGNATRRDHDTR